MKTKKSGQRWIWYFKCTVCGKQKAQSHRKKKAMTGMCARCRRSYTPENHPTLFDNPPVVNKLSTP